MPQKYRPSNQIWPTGSTYARFKIPELFSFPYIFAWRQRLSDVHEKVKTTDWSQWWFRLVIKETLYDNSNVK